MRLLAMALVAAALMVAGCAGGGKGDPLARPVGRACLVVGTFGNEASARDVAGKLNGRKLAAVVDRTQTDEWFVRSAATWDMASPTEQRAAEAFRAKVIAALPSSAMTVNRDEPASRPAGDAFGPAEPFFLRF